MIEDHLGSILALAIGIIVGSLAGYLLATISVFTTAAKALKNPGRSRLRWLIDAYAGGEDD